MLNGKLKKGSINHEQSFSYITEHIYISPFSHNCQFGVRKNYQEINHPLKIRTQYDVQENQSESDNDGERRITAPGGQDFIKAEHNNYTHLCIN